MQESFQGLGLWALIVSHQSCDVIPSCRRLKSNKMDVLLAADSDSEIEADSIFQTPTFQKNTEPPPPPTVSALIGKFKALMVEGMGFRPRCSTILKTW